MRIRHIDYQTLFGTIVEGEKYNAFGIVFVKVRWDSGYSEWIRKDYLEGISS
jgi:hypothetical protein